MLRFALLGFLFAGVSWAAALAQSPSPSKPQSDPKKNNTETIPPPPANDVELVERLIAARKEYEHSLKVLHEHYHRTGDKQRSQWVEKELMNYHLLWKPSYNLDVKDVPPTNLEAKVNVREANELFRAAMEYKGKGFGDEFVLNQRRAEVYFREILEKYPNSDKIADVAYQLGDLYESRAFRQYDRAARYYERSFQWVKGSRTDARLRAAVLYDRHLNERGRAIELYREEIAHDTDADRIRQAEKRLGELTGNKK
jgi:tetratricopeptide (TPR) repeat protein